MPNEMFLIIAAYAVALSGLLFFTAQPLLGILQQEGYEGGATVKWFFRRGNVLRRRYSLLALCLVLVTALLSLCFSFAGAEIAHLVAAVGYLGICVLYIYSFREATKVPFRYTHRAIRLSVCVCTLLAALLFGVMTGLYFAAEAVGTPVAHALLRPVPLSLIPLLFPFLIFAANAVMKLYEIPANKRYCRRAQTLLRESSCVKVGITGSFGKTSVKHFAAQILEDKFRVLATPASFNTPLGIARCVAKIGLDCDVFLAEMGARNTGDITELCDMVCPDYAIVTGVCAQHLETFGSLDAIKREKGVLARRAKTVVLGATCAEMAKEGALLEGRDFGAENIELTTEGSTFDLILGGQRLAVSTRVMGRHAAEDIALAAALAYSLGMTAEEIAARIPMIRPVAHRLEKLERGGLFILDDSYNANLLGVQSAVETLRLFDGKKYVVTPGMVELGELEERENAALGASLVGLDAVILVGETLVLAVRNGYLEAGGDDSKLRVVPTLKRAQEILAAELRAGDCVLFLNDLPDKYA